MDNAILPSDQRIDRKSASDSTTHDRKTGPGQKKEVASHIGSIIIAYNSTRSLVTG